MNKRFKAALMLSIWVLSLFSNFVIEASGAELPGPLSIKNNIIELLVNKEDGRFAIKTVEGSPDRQEDENAPLLFSKENPETTFTTFRIDGKDYIYGNSYNGISINGGLIEAPKKEGMVSISKWKAGDIEVTQKLELTDNINSSDVGNVKISYSIMNTGSKSRMVGTRVLLDTMLGSNDGSVISLNGEKDITFETEAVGENIPVYWRCTDSADNPKIVAYGFMKGWGNTEPDKMTIAHWSALSATKWDYAINFGRNIGSSLNDYKSADSAVALYWEPKTLEPGKTVQVETYYGLGNIKQSTDGSTFGLNVLAPAKLSIEGNLYKENPFDIMMELDNSLKDSTELAGITAELILPEGLELAEGQEGSKYFYRVPVNFKQTAAWKVKAVNTQRLKVLEYMLRITSLGKEIKNIKKYIIVPGFQNNDFDISYTNIAPRNLYYNDEDNAIQLIGYGFDKLKDKTSYEMSFVNTSGSNIHYPSASDITIVNDNQIRIKVPKGLEIGTYKLVINHQNDMLDYSFPQEVRVTSEEKYRSRNYGILVIKEHGTQLLENESQLSAEDKSSAILIIRGKVKSVSEGRFDVYGDTIAINNDIYYKGYEDNTLSVYKSGDSFIVKGNGELYMQSMLLGKSMEITLKKGRFYIDSATAIIKDEAGYINDISTMYVGYFPILVKEIKIQNNGEVKIDGILQLENKYFDFLASVGTGFIKSDLKDMSITNKKIDINTEFSIPFPRWKLGDFQSKDYLSKPTTQITFFINTTKGAYGFKTKAENLKLKLRDINAKMAFDKNLYPDYFEFENKYGLIPEPIGSTGLAFESIGGGLYGLRSLFDSLRYGILPIGSSIAVTADIVDLPTYHARIKGYTMVGLRDIEALLSSNGIDLKGDGYIYFIKVGDIVGHFDLSGGYVQADVDILDILIMEAYFGISRNEIKGSIVSKVKIPDYVWFVGGKTISSFKAGLSISEIEGSVKFMGVGVDIKYRWANNDFKFHVASLDYIDEKGIYTVNTKDDQGRDVVVTYGANIEMIEDIGYSYNVAYSDDMIKTLALGTSSYDYKVKIGESVESAIIEMKYDSTTKPEIEVLDPDGKPYILVDEKTGAENANYRNQIISADKSSSGVQEKRLFVTIVSPKSGNWTIKSDKLITTTLYNAKEPAVFKSLSAKQEEGKIKVDWELNKTEGSKVALYLIKENGASESIEIAKNLAGALGAYECEIPVGATTGNYKIRAEVKRDGTGFDDMYSEAFEIVDAIAPKIPTNFKVVAAGNGMMKAQWDNETGIDEYRIYAVDNEGKIDKSVEAMISVDGDKNNTIIGGTLFDADGNEYGWLPDRAYNFALYAIRKTLVGDLEAKEIEHISKPSYSGEVYLPAPKPPEFTVGFTSEYGNINIEKDQNDNDIRYTNTRNINCNYQSDMLADVTFYMNGDKVDGTKNKDYSLQLGLNSGSNMIEIEAVAENGDKTVKAYDFYYDDKVPDLMVQSPNSGDVIQGGSVLVSGKTTSGSMLYVNGTQMIVAEDGSFHEEYILSNIQRETITIASVDIAGNRTEYSAEVLNSDINNVVKVQILPSTEQLRVGDSIQMRLYGVTKDNKNILLESDKVNWLLYDTEGAATMTQSGLLTAVKPGEIIINGKYAISVDTIYEDALIINVMPRVNPEDNDNDDNNDSGEGAPIAIISGGAKTDSLIKKFLNFKANEEITIAGLIKLRFTGDEVSSKGYIEVIEIRDLLQYRQQSGNKDFRSNIFDIKVPERFQFNSPVELTLYFDKNKVKNLKHIAIYVYNEKAGIWDIVGGTVNEKDSSITVMCPHFSKYAVMENSKMTMMTDIGQHWAKDAIYRLIDRGIVNGIKSADGEYRFEPDRTVTRAEFAKMLSLSEGYRQSDIDTDLSQFADVEEILPWAQPYIKYCYKKGWINGKGSGEAVYMKPNDTITRAEAASMLGRTLNTYQFSNYDFTDREIIPQWAQKHVIVLSNLGIMKGYPEKNFRPNDKMTRAEAAALFDNYLKHIR